MDGSQFDAWTRRRFGAAVGGGLAALLGLSEREVLAVKGKGKGKKKKGKGKKKPPRCNLPVKAACERGNSQQCCKDSECGESVAIPEGTHCCRPAQGFCDDATECCKPSLCNVNEHRCCILDSEGPCELDEDCCEETSICNDVTHTCQSIL